MKFTDYKEKLVRRLIKAKRHTITDEEHKSFMHFLEWTRVYSGTLDCLAGYYCGGGGDCYYYYSINSSANPLDWYCLSSLKTPITEKEKLTYAVGQLLVVPHGKRDNPWGSRPLEAELAPVKKKKIPQEVKPEGTDKDCTKVFYYTGATEFNADKGLDVKSMWGPSIQLPLPNVS